MVFVVGRTKEKEICCRGCYDESLSRDCYDELSRGVFVTVKEWGPEELLDTKFEFAFIEKVSFVMM
jgi:hypothetical protein